MSQTAARQRAGLKLPPEVINIAGTSGALAAVVATGSAIVAVTPDPSTWEFAAAYLAPASLAFAIYWWIAQKL
jgi:hypothetical protein